MKRTILNTIAFLAIVGLSTLYSCKKEGMNPDVSNTPVVSNLSEVSAKNGRLVFKNEEAFKQHLQWVSKNEGKSKEIIGKYKHLGLEKSMREVSLESDKLSDDTESKEYSSFCKKYPNTFLPVEFENSTLYSLQGSPSMAYLANTDGLFQIGNDIHRISYSHHYVLKGGDESKVASLISAQGAVSDPSITVTSTHQQTTRTTGYYVTAYWNSNYRVVGESTYNYSGGISEMYVKTTAQKKTLGAWFQTNNVDYVYVQWPESTLYWGGGGTFTINGMLSAATKPTTGWYQVYSVYGQVDFSLSHCVAYHLGHGDGSNTVGYADVYKDIFH